MWLEFEQLSHRCLRGYGGEAARLVRPGWDGWTAGSGAMICSLTMLLATPQQSSDCVKVPSNTDVHTLTCLFFLFSWPVKQLQMNSLFLIFFFLKQLNSTAACLSYLLLSIDSVMMVFGCFFCFFLTVAHFRII